MFENAKKHQTEKDWEAITGNLALTINGVHLASIKPAIYIQEKAKNLEEDRYFIQLELSRKEVDKLYDNYKAQKKYIDHKRNHRM